MKTLIGCDEVFDILTRAPFPAGDEGDADLELHLVACHECRRLAEALRPAVGLFHEALQESQQLPAYTGKLKFETAAGRQDPRAWRATSWLPIAATAACILCAAFILKTRGSTGSVERPLAAGISVVDSWIELLDDLRLPTACRETAAPEMASDLSQQCCTRCHHANSDVGASTPAIVKSAAACLICHNDRQASLWYRLPLRESNSRIDYDDFRELRDRFVLRDRRDLIVFIIQLLREPRDLLERGHDGATELASIDNELVYSADLCFAEPGNGATTKHRRRLGRPGISRSGVLWFCGRKDSTPDRLAVFARHAVLATPGNVAPTGPHAWTTGNGLTAAAAESCSISPATSGRGPISRTCWLRSRLALMPGNRPCKKPNHGGIFS